MNSIYSYTRSELADYFKGIGEKAFKSDQLFDWLYKKREVNFDNMLNLNKSVISRLKTDMVIDSIKIIKKDEEIIRTAIGINERGELIVQDAEGRKEHIFSGEVSVRGVYGYV